MSWLKRLSPSAMKPAARMELFQGDITSLAVEAIVNAATESLLGGGSARQLLSQQPPPGR